MPDSLNQNPWHGGNTPGPQTQEMPKVSAPPIEVGIRTMASDIASMAESGGGPPQPQNVSLPSFKSEDRTESITPPAEKATPEHEEEIPHSPILKYFVLGVFMLLAAAALFFGSYYVLYPLLSGQKSPAPPVARPATSSTAAVQPVPAKPSFEHRSFFKQAVDGTFALAISSSSAGFQAVDQQLRQSLARFTSNSTFFEIVPQSPDGQPLAANDFLSSIGANILSTDFIASSFNQDFTAFLYKNKSGLPNRQAGLWPGCILRLKGNQTPFFFQSDVSKIENASASLQNLFLMSPGSPIGGFHDALISGQPIRILNFSNASSVLAYGWFFNKYLIISTSLDGLKQAIQRF